MMIPKKKKKIEIDDFTFGNIIPGNRGNREWL